MWRLYVIASLVLFVLACCAGGAALLWPPEQHGHGMGAALLQGYVLLAGAAAGANLLLMASLAYFRWVRGPKPPQQAR